MSAEWTREVPKRAGWYWIREPGGVVAAVRAHASATEINGTWIPNALVVDRGVEFWPIPIPPPPQEPP